MGPFSKCSFGVLKIEILGAFSKSTTRHLIVECEVVILWAFSMYQRPFVDLCFASKSFISVNWTILKDMQKIRTNSVN